MRGQQHDATSYHGPLGFVVQYIYILREYVAP